MSLTALWSQRRAIYALVMVLCMTGLFGVTHLPVAIFPSLVVPRIVVAADVGEAPVDATLVTLTRPLEAAVSTIPGVVKVLSTTTRGSADLDVTFDAATDMTLSLQRVQAQMADVRNQLPVRATVTSALINPSIFPVMGYSLSSHSHDLGWLRHLALYTVRPRLARLPGVAQIRVTGGGISEFLVSVHPAALVARGLTLQDVQDGLARANSITAVGITNQNYQRYQILVSGLLHTADDIGGVSVAARGGVPVLVRDVATVSLSLVPPTVLATGNGEAAVVVNVVKQASANTLQVADEVHQALAVLQRGDIPADVRTTLFYDQSDIVQQSENSVVEAIVIGGALALLVLFLFLGNLRAAAIVLVVLPLTLLCTFAFMQWLGLTLNIMTLGGLAVALGLVIDDGIVVVEDIFVGLEEGLSRWDAIKRGLVVITPGMLGSSFTTMAAFVPLTLVAGVTGQFFAPLALVMVVALGVSLVLALTVTPLFAAHMLPKEAPAENGSVLSRLLRFVPHLTDRLAVAYGRGLRACLRHPWRVLATLVPLLIVSIWLYGHLKTGFFPEFDEGAFVIDYLAPPGMSLEETDAMCSRAEEEIGKTPEVAGWSRLTGARSGSGLELSEPNQGDILVRLRNDRSRGADEVMADLRQRLSGLLPGMQIDMIQMLQDGIGDIAGAPQPIEVKFFGDDAVALRDTSDKAGDMLGRISGVVDVNNGVIDTGPSLMVQVDSLRAERAGFSTSDVASAVQASLDGVVATTVHQGEATVDVRVRADRQGRYIEPQAVPNLLLTVPASSPIRTELLDQLATLSNVPGEAQVTRENQQVMVALTARLEGRDLGSAMQEIQARLKTLPLPAGVRIEYGGLYASQQESFRQLAGVLAVAVLSISTLLLLQFRSVPQVIALMAAAILSQCGVLLALYLTGIPLNISSFTGSIMIIGVITENGVFLFDTYNVLRKDKPNASATDCLVEAGQHRLRPILMTKIGAILAMLPLALGFGAGAAMQQPLAVAVVGGLCIATFFTLLVAPALYVLLSKHQEATP